MPVPSSSRVVAMAIAGWAIPLLATIPIAMGHEAAAGESALGAGMVWLLALGPLGCAFVGGRAGLAARGTGHRADILMTGVAAVLPAVVVLIAWDAATPYVDLGVVGFAGVLPLVAGYVLGFGLGLIWDRARA